jgi:hypothetical protein
MTTLFTVALGPQAPWQVKDLQFNPEGHRLEVTVPASEKQPGLNLASPSWMIGKRS